jgi:hypothetical protein
MAVEQLVATFENGELWVKRGDRPVIHQPFRPAIGEEPRRDWLDEADAMTYWALIEEDSKFNGLTSEELEELNREQQTEE